VDILKLWSADPDLNEVALKLRADAKMGALKGYRSLCLIAHSMGGLAVQHALLDDRACGTEPAAFFSLARPAGCYRQAADPVLEATPRELESMYQQAIYLSRLISDQSIRRKLTGIFRPGEG